MLAVMVWDEEDPKTVRQYVQRNEIPYPVLPRGGAAGSAWRVRFLPDNFLLNRQGELAKRIGEITDRNVGRRERLIESMLR